MTGTEDLAPEDAIAAAAVRLAGQRGWRSLALADIAAEAGLPLAELSRHYVHQPEILDGFERMIDRRMLARAASEDTTDKPRDRLFDIIMERLDALLPFRDGIGRIARELPFDPPTGLVLAGALPRSTAWMFAGARIPIDGPLMPIKIAALGALYVSVLRTWLKDDGQDLAKTMAALDRQLDRAESLLCGTPARRAKPEGETSPPGGEPVEPEPPQAG
jgi:AcrR family transcriptional regulator